MLKSKVSFSAAALALLIGLLVASPANAANRENSWELGAFAPYVIFDDPTIDGVNVNADNSVGLGVRVGYNITSQHEIDLTLAMVSTDVSANVPGFGKITADTDFTLWQVGYTYNFGGDDIVPFLGGGIGSVNTSIDKVDFDNDDTLIDLNGGVRFFINDTFGIRVEGGLESVDSDPDRLNHLYVGAGVTFVLGG